MGKITITEKREAIIRRLNDPPLYRGISERMGQPQRQRIYQRARGPAKLWAQARFFAAVRAIEQAKESDGEKYMNYRPKVVRCRRKRRQEHSTNPGRNAEGKGLTYRDFENIQRSNEEFDGLVVLLSLLGLRQPRKLSPA